MTKEEAIDYGKVWLDMNDDAKDSTTYQFYSIAIKALEQEPILDKIRAEIENMQIVYDKSANYKDERTDEEKANDSGKMYKVLVLSIIDKYKAERSEEE